MKDEVISLTTEEVDLLLAVLEFDDMCAQIDRFKDGVTFVPEDDGLKYSN